MLSKTQNSPLFLERNAHNNSTAMLMYHGDDLARKINQSINHCHSVTSFPQFSTNNGELKSPYQNSGPSKLLCNGVIPFEERRARARALAYLDNYSSKNLALHKNLIRPSSRDLGTSSYSSKQASSYSMNNLGLGAEGSNCISILSSPESLKLKPVPKCFASSEFMPNRQTVGELFPQPKAENSGGSEDVIEADGNDSEDDDDFGEEAAYIRKVRSDNINERYENQRLDLRSSSTNLSSLNEFIKPHLHSGSIIPLASAFKRALRYNPARNITEHSRRFICLLKSKESSKTFFNTEENRGLRYSRSKDGRI